METPGTVPTNSQPPARGDTSEDFAYDALDRLLQAKDDAPIVNLTYDSLRRVLTELRGSTPLGTPLRSNRGGRAAGESGL